MCRSSLSVFPRLTMCVHPLCVCVSGHVLVLSSLVSETCTHQTCGERRRRRRRNVSDLEKGKREGENREVLLSPDPRPKTYTHMYTQRKGKRELGSNKWPEGQTPSAPADTLTRSLVLPAVDVLVVIRWCTRAARVLSPWSSTLHDLVCNSSARPLMLCKRSFERETAAPAYTHSHCKNRGSFALLARALSS